MRNASLVNSGAHLDSQKLIQWLQISSLGCSQLSIRCRPPLHFPHTLSHHHSLHSIQSCRAPAAQALRGIVVRGVGLQIMQGLPRVAGGVKEVQGMQVAFMVQGSIREFFLSGHN